MRAIHADITTLPVDAVVNAANSTLLGGGGVDGAIHRAAGPELLEACREIRRVDYPRGLPVGEAVITPGFRLPAAHVIHTVGPNWHRGQRDPRLLASAFRSCAELATRQGLTTLAYPAISAGAYGWEMAEVARIATVELASFPHLDITFALASDAVRQVWADHIRLVERG
ncbi:macro domain-containing protein [Trueperella pyogenes]|uniref:macro domain-containing protein n=1 Tax=Trueperella pyogenes TaxID=1661 RepID=UPI003132EA44